MKQSRHHLWPHLNLANTDTQTWKYWSCGGNSWEPLICGNISGKILQTLKINPNNCLYVTSFFSCVFSQLPDLYTHLWLRRRIIISSLHPVQHVCDGTRKPSRDKGRKWAAELTSLRRRTLTHDKYNNKEMENRAGSQVTFTSCCSVRSTGGDFQQAHSFTHWWHEVEH